MCLHESMIVNMCGAKMFCFSRANHTSTNFKIFFSWKLDKFTLFTHSLVGWNLENLYKHAVPIFFRLSWHFKPEKPFFGKHLYCKTRTDYTYIKRRVQDFATDKNLSFIQYPKQRVFLFSRESYFIKAIENFLPVFAQPDINTRRVGRVLDSYANPRWSWGFA